MTVGDFNVCVIAIAVVYALIVASRLGKKWRLIILIYDLL